MAAPAAPAGAAPAAAGTAARTAATTTSASGYQLMSGIGGTQLGRVVRLHPAVPVSTRWAMLVVVHRINAASGAGLVIGPDTTGAPTTKEIVVRAPAVTACGPVASGCLTNVTTTANGVNVVANALVEVSAAATGTEYELGILLHETAHAMGLSHFGDPYLGETQVMAPALMPGITDYRAGDRNGLRALTSSMSNPNVRGSVDSAAAMTTDLRVAGWAIDFDQPLLTLGVAVLVNGVRVGAATANLTRPDVGSAFPAAGSAHGYDLRVPLPADGNHQVCVSATGGRGQAVTLGCRSVTIKRSPIGNHEMTAQHGPGRIRVTGWALDPDTTAPIDVHVYIDGRWGGAVLANQSRPDVGAAFPAWGADHGWSITLDAGGGPHQVCAYGINVGPGSSNPLLSCRSVTVAAGAPVGNLEMASIVSADGGTWLSVSGWSLDPDTTASIGVHLYIDGRWGGAVTAAGYRPDVGRVWAGYGTAHGFRALLPRPSSGTHSICAYGINTGPGLVNPLLGCRAFNVAV
jgi:hypothetical protein